MGSLIKSTGDNKNSFLYKKIYQSQDLREAK